MNCVNPFHKILYLPEIKIKTMGRGDKKSKRGKITIGSNGVRRPRKKKTSSK